MPKQPDAKPEVPDTVQLIHVVEAACGVRAIAFDVDGVLTDGRIIYSSTGEEVKAFDVRDGHAIKLAMRAGLEVGFITGRESPMVTRRAKELGVRRLYQGAKEKGEVLAEFLAATGLASSQVAYVGDDLVDLPVILKVGLGCAVADAAEEVRARAAYVTKASGGRGAAREVIKLILEAQGQWERIMEKYLGGKVEG